MYVNVMGAYISYNGRPNAFSNERVGGLFIYIYMYIHVR